MIYKLAFLEDAHKEWRKLDSSIRHQFEKKLKERLQKPHISSAALSGMTNCYKIKLRKAGYRLVYRVFDDRVVVQVIAVGKRDKNEVYDTAMQRLLH